MQLRVDTTQAEVPFKYKSDTTSDEKCRKEKRYAMQSI